MSVSIHASGSDFHLSLKTQCQDHARFLILKPHVTILYVLKPKISGKPTLSYKIMLYKSDYENIYHFHFLHSKIHHRQQLCYFLHLGCLLLGIEEQNPLKIQGFDSIKEKAWISLCMHGNSAQHTYIS